MLNNLHILLLLHTFPKFLSNDDRFNDIQSSLQLSDGVLPLLNLPNHHSTAVKVLLAVLPNLLYNGHCGERLRDEFAIVLHCAVSASLKRERRVDSKLLARRFPERLRPTKLSRVPLHVEVLPTFRTAEPKLLGVVPYEYGAVTGVDC